MAPSFPLHRQLRFEEPNMANGKPGDHPITDMLVHGMHPFPADIEQMVRKLLSLNPQFPDDGRRYNEQVEWDNRFFCLGEGRGT